MIDNAQASRFEQEENGLKVWADYRISEGQHLIPHVEAEPALRGTGAASRLMQAIVEHARAHRLVIVPRCSYAQAWFARHPDAQDVLG
jgi:uncharacterized protein